MEVARQIIGVLKDIAERYAAWNATPGITTSTNASSVVVAWNKSLKFSDYSISHDYSISNAVVWFN